MTIHSADPSKHAHLKLIRQATEFWQAKAASEKRSSAATLAIKSLGRRCNNFVPELEPHFRARCFSVYMQISADLPTLGMFALRHRAESASKHIHSPFIHSMVFARVAASANEVGKGILLLVCNVDDGLIRWRGN